MAFQKTKVDPILGQAVHEHLVKCGVETPTIANNVDRKTKIEQGLKDSEKAKEMLENVETETVMKNEKAFCILSLK